MTAQAEENMRRVCQGRPSLTLHGLPRTRCMRQNGRPRRAATPLPWLMKYLSIIFNA
ncbi:hypothetical protein COCC4DRAFT_29597 [Bipolaris maydis ATCC 48331]|uniref:Uncharacterized protein n=2 Tax=Cochliobolus heterostrophus TaxID=5016 RepID=M2V8C5_COCH5|nr:uncharacterized protein COCC4DRAFT_29597 [Bipolaris maydis ATCC 48331]EMD96237.1 hypothetical protein COCHEDRAFT_1019610 [Bipolaris maydis C5]ENI11096.1 hypothetical protein COCC4DRAFT_29597 [Bipolaris maydis ATCC 48331]